VWSKSNTGADALLSNAHRNSLQLATQNDVKTIAFSNINTGIYHFPKDKAAEIAIRTVKDFLS
jgi:O-acetyl-ADP-ribose deacetylase (regulator of RNase III)